MVRSCAAGRKCELGSSMGMESVTRHGSNYCIPRSLITSCRLPMGRLLCFVGFDHPLTVVLPAVSAFRSVSFYMDSKG